MGVSQRTRVLFPHLEGREVLIKPVHMNTFTLSTNLLDANGNSEEKIYSNEYLMRGSACLLTGGASTILF